MDVGFERVCVRRQARFLLRCTGIFSLPMRKAKPSMWPRLTERDQTDEHTDEPASSYEPATDPEAAFWVRSQPTLGPVQDT